MKLNLTIIAVILTIAATSSTQITCYYSNGDSVITYQTPNNTYLCASYEFTCTNGDNACNATEQAAGTNKTLYIFTSQQTCDTMMSNPTAYRNVVCCNTDLCNAPAGTPNSSEPMAATPVTAPTGTTAPKAATPIKASFGNVVVPSTVLLASVIALIC